MTSESLNGATTMNLRTSLFLSLKHVAPPPPQIANLRIQTTFEARTSKEASKVENCSWIKGLQGASTEDEQDVDPDGERRAPVGFAKANVGESTKGS
ncbi:hypothetical protein C1H46_015346 [Malus baccata]|uniref:Uncharacterized protein n=1 Tax=Malus baccata TaxID=106549 RepID=A0A540ML01_MALBA|nr:hypothetical protein C1H46_015346 [Malus baccata]